VADAFRPLTLLLAAVCLWALSILVLAMAGLGSRFPALGNVGTPPPLPNVALTRSHSRLGPIEDYVEVGQRPLMTPDRRPAAQLAANGEGGAAELDVTLTSVLITPRLQLAILTDNKDGGSRRVRVGETISGSNWRLMQLQPRSAIIEGPSGQRTLELRVFDGRSGELPTPLASGQAQPPRDPSEVPPPPPPQPPVPTAQSAVPQAANAKPEPAPLTQEQQVEAIRRRIEARRAQMRAEAESSGHEK
jgi:general secretion pathway protein N